MALLLHDYTIGLLFGNTMLNYVDHTEEARGPYPYATCFEVRVVCAILCHLLMRIRRIPTVTHWQLSSSPVCRLCIGWVDEWRRS